MTTDVVSACKPMTSNKILPRYEGHLFSTSDIEAIQNEKMGMGYSPTSMVLPFFGTSYLCYNFINSLAVFCRSFLGT